VAAKAGTFVIKCSEYCGPGHKQMLGTLVVTARGGGQ
jgi:heme/copper-type cytochrome/quinol oxidase subunit 2